MRSSLRQLLDHEQDMEVIAEAGDLESVLRHVQDHRPDVLVLDLGLSGGSGSEAIGELRDRAQATEIVLLTMEDDPAFVQHAFVSGALGFVLKDLADTELPRAIRAAARGEEYISPRVATPLAALHRTLTEDKLTPREVEVLRLIALGYTSAEIARKLQLSPRTVETHRAHIFTKLACTTRAGLVRYALRRGLLRA